MLQIGGQTEFFLCCKKDICLLRYKNLHESVLKLNSRVENLIKKHGENGVTGRENLFLRIRLLEPVGSNILSIIVWKISYLRNNVENEVKGKVVNFTSQHSSIETRNFFHAILGHLYGNLNQLDKNIFLNKTNRIRGRKCGFRLCF